MKVAKHNFGAILAILTWFYGGSAQATVMTVSTTSGSAGVDQNIAVDISVSDAIDLSAFQFDISFDPTILRADSIAEGTFLASAGSTFFLPGTIDNLAGTIEFNIDSLIGVIPGANGGGILESIVFHTPKDGLSALALSNIVMLDSAANDLEFAGKDGAVVVGRGNSVPEPTTLLLVISAIVVIFARAQSTRRVASTRRFAHLCASAI